MAKATKEANRRAVVEQLRREQQRKERRQGLLVLGLSVGIGIAILVFAGVMWVKSDQQSEGGLRAIGESSDAAACQPVVKHEPKGAERSGATGNHVGTGAPIKYAYSPPAFGQHWPNYLVGTELRPFYSTDDRPPVERLVHSLEHGYTILWYDSTIADDDQAVADVEAVAKKFDTHFIAAPWTDDDGSAMPDGAHVALTHWSRGGVDAQGNSQVGVWQYCDGVSGAAVSQFTKDYPAMDAPEPGGA